MLGKCGYVDDEIHQEIYFQTFGILDSYFEAKDVF